MANTLLTPTVITRASQVILHNSSVLLKTVNRSYDDQFAVSGAKIGDTINLRLPNRFIVSKGTALAVQDIAETSKPLTLNTQWHVDFTFSNAALTLTVDEFSDRYLKPAMGRLASQIDYDGMTATINAVYNQVGTGGTTPGLTTGGTAGDFSYSGAPDIFLAAGAMLDNFAVPTQDRMIILNPKAQAMSVKALSGLFNDQDTISTQFVSGRMGHALNFDFAMSQNVNRLLLGSHAAASLAAVQVNGANQTGSTINLKGFTASQTNVLRAGEVISFTNVVGLNPETQVPTGELQQFVVTANANSDSSGLAAVSISPAITVASASLATATVTASPADSAQVILDSSKAVGIAANTSFPVNLAYHKDAIAFGSADLILPNGVHFSGREQYEGVSMSVVSQFSISDYTMPTRIDILGGWAVPRPEMACRIAG